MATLVLGIVKETPVRILVTGGLGVNGARVTARLVRRGAAVTVVDVRDDRSLLDDPDGGARLPVDVIVGDATDPELLASVLRDRRIDRLVHMAALVGAHPPKDVFAVNAAGTVAVLEAAREAGTTRVVFTSSRAVYGNITGPAAHPTYEPIREDHPCDPVRAYDIAKLASEQMGGLYRREFGIEFTALRFASILAPGKLVRHSKTSIYSRIIEDCRAGRPVRVERGAEQRDDVIYVEDAAAAVAEAVTHDGSLAPAYNVARGAGTTLLDFAAAVRAHIPDADIQVGPGLDYFDLGVQYYGVLDGSAARRDLGFQPGYDLTAAIGHYLDTVRWRERPDRYGGLPPVERAAVADQ